MEVTGLLIVLEANRLREIVRSEWVGTVFQRIPSFHRL